MTNLESAQTNPQLISALAAPLRPELSRTASGARVFLELVQASAGRIAETAEAFLNTDHPEATHQLRVALRRHRSLLKLFAPHLDADFATAQATQAQQAARRLGPLRETDVMAGETLPALAEAARQEARRKRSPATKERAEAIARSFETLAKKLRAQAETKRSALRRSDLGVAVARLLLDLNKALTTRSWSAADEKLRCEAAGRDAAASLDGKASRLARRALDRAYRKLKRWGDRIEALTIEERHEMRKKAKVLRYAVEFFGSLFEPEQVKPYRRALKKMQESFGALNDAADALKLRDLPAEPELLPAIEAAIAKSEALMEKEFPVAAKGWRALADTPPFWR